MSAYRRGDAHVEVAGRVYRLRLTLAALAEIADRFAAESPAALAAKIRAAEPQDWAVIFCALATPRPKPAPSAKDIAPTLDAMTRLIADGLVP